MAQNVSLIGELVVSIVGRHVPHDDADLVIRSSGDAALRTLRNHRFARTNQFNVRRSLEGQVEKFQLFNNDALADALHSRLRRLALVDCKFAPDILALLLLLSEDPAAQPGVDRLERLKPTTPPPAPLTWQDIVGDDPFYNDEIPFHSLSGSASDISESDIETGEYGVREFHSPPIAPKIPRLSRVPEEVDASCRAESLVVDVDTSAFDDIANKRDSAAVGASNGTSRITELQSVREVLFMLHGLPSFLFEARANSAQLVPVNNVSIDHLSRPAYTDLLAAFADIGSVLTVLRRNVPVRHSHTLLHAFEAGIDRQVQDIDNKLTEMEQLFAKADGQVVVSLLNTLVRVRSFTKHLPVLTEIVINTTNLAKGYACHLLDRLYDCACELQATSEDESFRIIASIFLDCLNAFLRSVRQWMENGQLETGFELISTSAYGAPVDSSMFWERKFSLQAASGSPMAPRFLMPLVPLVFSSGKSVAFLKELGIEANRKLGLSTPESPLELDLTTETGDGSALLPFSVLLDQRLRDWVSSSHQFTSATLCDHLLHRFGVARTVDALEHLYLSKDGAVFESFADRIFSRLDIGSNSWNDPDAVANIAQYVFGAIECIDSVLISVARVTFRQESHGRSTSALSSFKLNYNNILPIASLHTYQRIFSFLIQIHRASTLLSLRNPRTSKRSHVEPVPIKSSNRAAEGELEHQVHTLKHHLRHRLLHYVRTLQGYITQTAIQLSCLSFREALAAAKDVDEMVAAHASFIGALERRCLMEEDKHVDNVRKALTSLLDLVYAFAHLEGSSNHLENIPADGRNDRAASHSIPAPVPDLGADEESEEPAPVTEIAIVQDPTAESDIRALHTPELEPQALLARLRQMKAQYANLLSITIAGLRSAGREKSAEEAWEELAERLEWSLGR